MDTSYLVWAGLAVLLVASLVVAYYSSRTWNAVHVALVYSIFLTTVVFVYLSAKALQIRQVYGKQAAQLQVQLDGLRADNIKHAASINQVRHELHKLTFNRGGVWRQCQLAQAAADGRVSVRIPQPEPHGVKKDTILLLFEEGPSALAGQGPRYLGEFKVTGADPEGQTVTLSPAVDLTDAKRERVAAGNTTWSLYEVMPMDRHDLFAQLDAEQLKATIPSTSLEEYVRDGKVAADDDPDERVIGVLKDGSWASLEVLRDNPKKLDQVVEKRYVRQLRAYQFLFRELGRQRAVDGDAIAQSQRDSGQLKQALDRAHKDVAYREAEKAKLAADLKGFEFERAVAAHHLRAIDAQHANLLARLAAVRARNRALAGQLASLQLDAAGQIGRRTGALPESGGPALSIQ